MKRLTLATTLLLAASTAAADWCGSRIGPETIVWPCNPGPTFHDVHYSDMATAEDKAIPVCTLHFNCEGGLPGMAAFQGVWASDPHAYSWNVDSVEAGIADDAAHFKAWQVAPAVPCRRSPQSREGGLKLSFMREVAANQAGIPEGIRAYGEKYAPAPGADGRKNRTMVQDLPAATYVFETLTRGQEADFSEFRGKSIRVGDKLIRGGLPPCGQPPHWGTWFAAPGCRASAPWSAKTSDRLVARMWADGFANRVRLLVEGKVDAVVGYVGVAGIDALESRKVWNEEWKRWSSPERQDAPKEPEIAPEELEKVMDMLKKAANGNGGFKVAMADDDKLPPNPLPYPPFPPKLMVKDMLKKAANGNGGFKVATADDKVKVPPYPLPYPPLPPRLSCAGLAVELPG